MATTPQHPPATPAHPGRNPEVSSVLRTLLLCDWADSTKLIETLGDARAVGLMQQHDQFIRDTLLLTHGRLIDKSDGILALFERPIQALDFALRYQQQMRVWGAQYQQPIQARIGIHVGDVMTWENAADQIAAGAKPLEVEGFAKPVAARLMGLAMPGQILLSGMAQSLAQRAQLELGERGQKLRWLLHGRYHFKGVAAPMLVHEVGDVDFSPLRVPVSTQKAWREVPLWRRPPILALEVLLTTGIIGGLIWGAFQSSPAIAFYERDWVVMADLQNLTSEKMFDESLDTALRVGLEQSAYVNVISDVQEQEALKRMQREGERIDRQTGAEIALRENAKALVLPTITEVGGRLRVTAEVINPATGITVYTESADAKNASDVLPALDVVLAKLRTRLGEPIGLVDNSKPLQQVTTKSIEALRAYSLALEAKRDNRLIEARNLANTAIKLDPEFSLAYVTLGSLDFIDSNYLAAENNWQLAGAKRQRLSLRESLLLDAASSIFSAPKTMLGKWKQLASMYPDEYVAYYNFAYFSAIDNLDYQSGLDFLKPAFVPQNPNRYSAFYLKGLLDLALNNSKEAKKAFEQSQSSATSGYNLDYAAVYAVQRNYDAALTIVNAENNKAESLTPYQREARLMYSVDRGRWDEAIRQSRELEQISKTEIPGMVRTYRGMQLSLRSYAPDATFSADLRQHIADIDQSLKQNQRALKSYGQFDLLAAGVMALHSGDVATASEVYGRTKADAQQSGQPKLISMAICLEAEILLAQGKNSQAKTLLEAHIQQDNELYYAHAVLLRALMANKEYPAAMQESDWLIAFRGRAYAENVNDKLWQPSNLAESNLAQLAAAEIEKKLGKPEQAELRRIAFITAWPGDNIQKVVHRRAQTF